MYVYACQKSSQNGRCNNTSTQKSTIKELPFLLSLLRDLSWIQRALYSVALFGFDSCWELSSYEANGEAAFLPAKIKWLRFRASAPHSACRICLLNRSHVCYFRTEGSRFTARLGYADQLKHMTFSFFLSLKKCTLKL